MRGVAEHARHGDVVGVESHPPGKPILTVKEAAVHLSIVTVGILIALSLEGLLEWRHHRALAREARANIETEMRDNQKELQKTRGRIDDMSKTLSEAVTTVDAMTTAWDAHAATKLFATPGPTYVMFRFTVAELHSTSYATAQATGALSYMEYDEAKRYAEIYKSQDTYLREQEQTADYAITAASLGIGLLKKPSSSEIDGVKRQLLLASGGLTYEKSFADILLRQYARVLEPAR